MNKKNGFTLVELLAVIVILAIILVIAVPQIISTITEARKGVLVSSAKLIASTAESMKLSNNTLGVNEEIECTDVAQLTREDYDTCKIDFIDGNAYVSIIGKGKFEGMAVLSGTVEKAEAIRTTGLELTDDGNIRYTGSSPSNYIEFGNDNELWRIIGTFEVTTASGKTEKLIKIVRNDSIGNYSWDSSKGNNSGTHEDGEVNDGYGVNQWGASTYTDGSAYEGADLMRELNTLYLNSESGTCYNEKDEARTDCDFSTTGIKETYRSMIESVIWNTAGFRWGVPGKTGHSALTAYQAERGTITGQTCKDTTYQDGALCTDTVNRTITWTGKIALIYPSDYGFASTNKDCRNWINATDENKRYCKNDNWLHNNTSYWTLSPHAEYDYSYNAWIVNSTGFLGNYYARAGIRVHPTIYLKSDVSITSGDGSSSNPFQVSMN